MTSANMQIVQLYEQEGLSPEEIAKSDLGFDLLSVKATLLQNSSVYREVLKGLSGDKSLEDAFTREDQIAVRDVIRNIALYGNENPELQFRAAKYMRDDAKGRLDIAAGITGLNINVTLLQEQLEKVQRAKALTLEKRRAIEAKSSVTKEESPEAPVRGRRLYTQEVNDQSGEDKDVSNPIGNNQDSVGEMIESEKHLVAA